MKYIFNSLCIHFCIVRPLESWAVWPENIYWKQATLLVLQEKYLYASQLTYIHLPLYPPLKICKCFYLSWRSIRTVCGVGLGGGVRGEALPEIRVLPCRSLRLRLHRRGLDPLYSFCTWSIRPSHWGLHIAISSLKISPKYIHIRKHKELHFLTKCLFFNISISSVLDDCKEIFTNKFDLKPDYYTG